MRTFYSVRTTFDDNGKVTATVGSITHADGKPEQTMQQLPDKGVYTDWFPNLTAAKRFARNAQTA